MIENNLDYLKSNIRNHGFGEGLYGELEAQLRKGVAEFTLSHQSEINKQGVEATLYFKKSTETEMYFFNKYDMRMRNEKKETMAQTFYINKGWGITLKEGYNLLNGRTVFKELADKEGQKYQAWVQLDFASKDKNGNFERKQYHSNYGFDLKEAMSYYSIKEMQQSDDQAKLLRSLERGNVQQITITIDDKEVKAYMEANPQYKTVTLYDAHMKRMSKEERNELMQKPQSPQENEKREVTTTRKSEKKTAGPKDNSLFAKKDNGLLEKKRSGGRKGMGIQ